MPSPALSSFAADLYARLAPMAFDEANQNYSLANYLGGVGQMFQVVEDYGRDQLVNGKYAPGWSQLMDINRCPSSALGWLAQFVGVRLQTGLSDAAQRARIQGTDGWKRGSVGALIAAAQQYLTGSQTVLIRERDPAACALQPAYGLTIITRTSETPDSAAVLKALLLQKPGGIILVYTVLAGQDYTILYNGGVTTYANVFSTYLTYGGVANGVPGT